MYGKINRWMDDGRVNEWMDGMMDRQVNGKLIDRCRDKLDRKICVLKV